MSRVVHHYSVPLAHPEAERGAYIVAKDLPAGTKVLTAMMREGKVAIYVSKPICEDGKCSYYSSLECFYVATGQEYDDKLIFGAVGEMPTRYVGTVTNPANGEFFHVFARICNY